MAALPIAPKPTTIASNLFMLDSILLTYTHIDANISENIRTYHRQEISSLDAMIENTFVIRIGASAAFFCDFDFF
jgi:hypothetical protein